MTKLFADQRGVQFEDVNFEGKYRQYRQSAGCKMFRQPTIILYQSTAVKLLDGIY